MQIPFSITVFATTCDPQVIRYVDKSNWSVSVVVFQKEQLHQTAGSRFMNNQNNN
jgi:hypothetical protein